jgi:hypothetical protein
MPKVKTKITDDDLDGGPVRSRIDLIYSLDQAGALKSLKMEIHGKAAQIPSLKNRKRHGGKVPFLDPAIKYRIRVLDYLYNKTLSQHDIPPFSWGTQKVVLIVICARRKVSFDADNVLTTVRDWLEPSVKKFGKGAGKSRGWGIGLVDNDKYITGLVFTDRDLGLNLDHTLIFMRPWSDVHSDIFSFLNKEFFGI